MVSERRLESVGRLVSRLSWLLVIILCEYIAIHDYLLKRGSFNVCIT
jgi:hypothetical protein